MRCRLAADRYFSQFNVIACEWEQQQQHRRIKYLILFIPCLCAPPSLSCVSPPACVRIANTFIAKIRFWAFAKAITITIFYPHWKRPLCIRLGSAVFGLLFSLAHTNVGANARVLYCQHSDASHWCPGPYTHTHCCLIRYSKIRFSILTGMKLI